MSADNRATSETYVTDPVGRIDDRDERTVVEGTDEQRAAFAAKMAEWRRTGGVPGYTGPRAAR